MHDTHALKAPVAIVGGGPVGMMLALFLDRHGVPVVLFNSERTTRWHPKGNTHNARTMEHYRRLGLSDGIRRLGLPADHPRDVAYFTRLNGWELARLDMPAERERLQAARQAPDTDQVPEPLLRANQMYVERFLLDHLRTRPGIQLRFGWRVDDFQQDADGVSLHAVDSAGQAADEHWRADYLVGCDGGHSFVRRRLGIGYIGPDGSTGGFLSGRMFSSHVRIPDLHRRLLPDRKAWMYNVVAPEGRLLLISLDGADEFLLMTQARSHDDMPQDDAVIRAIQRGIGEPVEVSVLAHAVWHGGLALVAERFADRRVLLAGDATHLFSPTGGFGMNTGIDGAANLAWKLAAAVQGWAGDGLLATYELERRPVTLRNTHAARRLTQRVGQVDVPAEVEDPGPAGQQARARLGEALQQFRGQFASLGVELGARYDGSPILWPDDGTPPEDDPLLYRPSTLPGGRLPHLWIADGSTGRCSVFDRLGVGFTLLRNGPQAPEATRLVEAARARGIPLEVVDLPATAFTFYAVQLLLVRPDQHIGWRGDALPEDAGALLDRLVGQGVAGIQAPGPVLGCVFSAVG